MTNPGARIPPASQEQLNGAGSEIAALDRTADHFGHRCCSRPAMRRYIELDIRHRMAAARSKLHLPGSLTDIDGIERNRKPPFALFLEIGPLEARHELDEMIGKNSTTTATTPRRSDSGSACAERTTLTARSSRRCNSSFCCWVE